MRKLTPFSALLLTAIAVPAIAVGERVVSNGTAAVPLMAAAGDVAGGNSNLPDSHSQDGRADQAEQLENSLRAVEWYTNEYMRKALHAEADGDISNAQLFGDKAIASDQNAAGMREQAAAAWLQAHEPRKARQVWHRAGDISKERAELLAKRVPATLAQWQHDQAAAGAPAAALHEHEAIYLQAMMITTQQWVRTAEFYARADETKESQAMWREAGKLLAILQQQTARLQAYQKTNPRLKNAIANMTDWQNRMPVTDKP